jgi:hypothetical protein
MIRSRANDAVVSQGRSRSCTSPLLPPGGRCAVAPAGRPQRAEIRGRRSHSNLRWAGAAGLRCVRSGHRFGDESDVDAHISWSAVGLGWARQILGVHVVTRFMLVPPRRTGNLGDRTEICPPVPAASDAVPEHIVPAPDGSCHGPASCFLAGREFVSGASSWLPNDDARPVLPGLLGAG